MKTKLQIIGIALLGFILASCSSSMYLSKSSATTDDIYYTPSKSANLESINNSEVANTPIDNSQNTSPSKFDELEKKYANANNQDTLTISSDTLAAKVESTNPYERILSDSYQDSYERRLRAMSDPSYGMENFVTRYSDDYWYASAYDPAFYNIIVMGNQVWVEPRYISSMFLTPHNHSWLGVNYGFGAGFGWNWSSWYNDYSFSPYGGFSSWYGYNPYSYDYWNSNHSFHNGYYGRRAGSSMNITSPNRRTEISYENQFESSHRRNGTTIESGINSANNVRTRNSNQIDNRTGQTNNGQVVIGRSNRSGDLNTTRLRNEATTRNLNMTEPTRTNNVNYQRPRSTNNSDYIRTSTRNQNINSGATSRDNTTRNTSTVRENRNASPTYNRPNRVDSSTERGRSTTSGTTVRESSSTRSSARESSSSSSSSSNSSSSNSSNSSSSSSSSRRR